MLVFIDTSAWVALFFKRDQYHKDASEIWKEIISRNSRLYTTDYVFDETVTLLRRRAGYYASKTDGDSIMKSSRVEMVFIDKEIVLRAWEVYEKYKDHELSVTDCSSIAFMNIRRIKNVFEFDPHFGQAGFRGPGKWF